MKGCRTGIMAELRNLIDSGFFSEPKNFSSTKTELFMNGMETKVTSLNMMITKIVERVNQNRQKRSLYVLQVRAKIHTLLS